jgi:hypothetical protein
VSIFLQILLLAACLLTFFFLVRRIRTAHVQIRDAVFWIGLSVLLLVVSLVPRWVERLALLVGVVDTTNFVFLVVIFILLVKLFNTSVQLSRLDSRLNHLAQQIALAAMPEEPARPESAAPAAFPLPAGPLQSQDQTSPGSLVRPADAPRPEGTAPAQPPQPAGGEG